MANATAITVTALPGNTVVAQPTGNALDTGTAAVTLYTSAVNESDRLIFECTNTAAAAATFSVVAGDNPPAFRAGLGALTSSNVAQNGVVILGPLESARFMQNDGTVGVTTTPSTGTIAATIRCYKLGKV